MTMNLSELCAKELYEQCKAVQLRQPLVRLKGTPKKVDPFEHFFTGDEYWHLEYAALPSLDSRKGLWRKDSLVRKTWLYFNENSQRITDRYIRNRWNNDLRAAMTTMGRYDDLHKDFLAYFEDRRKKFLEQEEKAIAQAQTANLMNGSVPKSHGGVANLLKVLTKTMIAQGSSILTIAKVQYAICIQAGIMLPNEFLTDVLVADDMMEGNT